MALSALFLSVSLATLAGAGLAHAQDLRSIQARNAAAHVLEDARRDLLASQIEASNANERARTDVRLRALEGQLTGTARPGALTVTPARPLEEVGRREADLSNAASRLERLTQEALAQSNARMRAIRPASQRKAN